MSPHRHRVYLDNTYLDPGCEFPSRDVVAAEIAAHINARPPGSRVYLGLDSIGKEQLLLAIAAAAKKSSGGKVFLPRGRLEVMHAAGLPTASFTVDPTAASVHVCAKRQLSGLMARDDAVVVCRAPQTPGDISQSAWGRRIPCHSAATITGRVRTLSNAACVIDLGDRQTTQHCPSPFSLPRRAWHLFQNFGRWACRRRGGRTRTTRRSLKLFASSRYYVSTLYLPTA